MSKKIDFFKYYGIILINERVDFVKVLNITKEELKNLKRMPLDESIYNTESKLFLINKGDVESNGYFNETKVFKSINYKKGNYFGNKLNTLHLLIDNKDKIGIEKLVMPEKLITVDGTIEGFVMPYVENYNLGLVLQSKLSRRHKIDYMKQIGGILRDIKDVRENRLKKDFYINDLHAGNLIVDNKDEVNVVDVDSFKIGDVRPFKSMYLDQISLIHLYPHKYRLQNDRITPTEDTDLLCYTMIILDMLSMTKTHLLDQREFFEYLNYLEEKGVNKKFVGSVRKLFSKYKNSNPEQYLDDLIYGEKDVSYDSFCKVKKR